MEQIPQQTPEQRRTDIGNKIQIDIALARALNNNEDAGEVIKRNADLIGEYIDTHRGILDEYEKDKASALAKIEEIIQKREQAVYH